MNKSELQRLKYISEASKQASLICFTCLQVNTPSHVQMKYAFASFKHYYGQVTALIFNAMKWLFDFQNAF